MLILFYELKSMGKPQYNLHTQSEYNLELFLCVCVSVLPRKANIYHYTVLCFPFWLLLRWLYCAVLSKQQQQHQWQWRCRNLPNAIANTKLFQVVCWISREQLWFYCVSMWRYNTKKFNICVAIVPIFNIRRRTCTYTPTHAHQNNNCEMMLAVRR